MILLMSQNGGRLLTRLGERIPSGKTRRISLGAEDLLN